VPSAADALLRLAGAVLVEAHDEWQVSDRRYVSEGSMALLTTTPNPKIDGELAGGSTRRSRVGAESMMPVRRRVAG
jgi:hypothetical protein